MRLWISIAVITATLVSVVPDLHAGLAFQHDRTFPIPGLSGTIRQMRFNDIDADGVPEVLASTSAKVVLYSISGDSMIFSAVPDSGYAVTAIELADVDRDSLADVVIMSDTHQGVTIPDSVMWKIESFASTANFGTSQLDSISTTSLYYPTGSVSAVDLDNDGFSELLVSVDEGSTSCIDLIFYCWESSEGKTLLYRSFPESLSWSSNALWTAPHEIRFPGGALICLANRHSYSAGYGGHLADYSEDTDILKRLLSDGSEAGLAEASFETSFDCWFDYREYYGVAFAAAGNLDFDSQTLELLVMHGARFRCYEMFIDSAFLDTSRMDMSMYHLDESGNTGIMWSLEIKGKGYRDFTYHPNLPGYFFAFSADTLVLFRGVDGSVHSKLTDVPLGSRYWDYPYADGIPRLVVTNGMQVSLYNLDVSTDLDGEPEQSLPHTFILGKPYPNPFNAELMVPVTLSKSHDMAVDVFNIVGERVARLHEGKGKAGENLITWDASGVSSGIYLIRAQAAGETRTVKAVLLK